MSQVRFFGLDNGDNGMASNASNGSSETETVAHNNNLQLSVRDKKLVDDLRGMEDSERIREVVEESIERYKKDKAVRAIGG